MFLYAINTRRKTYSISIVKPQCIACSVIGVNGTDLVVNVKIMCGESEKRFYC